MSLRRDNEEESRSINIAIQDKQDGEEIEYPTKWLRVRSRLTGAVCAYCSYSGMTYDELVDQKGYKMFRVMWGVGDSQDDIIDDNVEDIKSQITRPQDISKLLFEEPFYQIALKQLNEYIIEIGEVSPSSATYLRRKIASWYHFLAYQEYLVIKGENEFSFDYCRDYREQQNMKAGALMTALLSGVNADKKNFRSLESLIPILSLRTQIIDDIQDLKEDIETCRPNIAYGALVENPNELAALEKYLKENPNIVKLTPKAFRSYAPKSFIMTRELFQSYGNKLREMSSERFYIYAGDILFRMYPIYRDFVFQIDPKKATF